MRGGGRWRDSLYASRSTALHVSPSTPGDTFDHATPTEENRAAQSKAARQNMSLIRHIAGTVATRRVLDGAGSSSRRLRGGHWLAGQGCLPTRTVGPRQQACPLVVHSSCAGVPLVDVRRVILLAGQTLRSSQLRGRRHSLRARVVGSVGPATNGQFQLAGVVVSAPRRSTS